MEKDLITQYFELQREVHNYFGYKEDWTVIPLNDDREYFWHLLQNNDGGGKVVMWDGFPSAEKTVDGNNLYIYTQRFLPKWVYHGEEWTMVCTDTHIDGNRFLSVLDNQKEIKELPTELLTALNEWL